MAGAEKCRWMRSFRDCSLSGRNGFLHSLPLWVTFLRALEGLLIQSGYFEGYLMSSSVCISRSGPAEVMVSSALVGL